MQTGLPFDEPTYSVSEVCAEIRAALRAAPARWVAGEVQRIRRSRAGHLYFELIEKGDGDQVVGKLEGVVWRRDLQGVERELESSDQELREGLEIRCRGEIDFYPPFGRLQLVVREVDPVFLLGQLSRRRRETLQALSQAGLIDANRQRDLARVPLGVALITSEGSAAYHDFLEGLRESGYGFRVVMLHASVQGSAAEREIASALTASGDLPVDCVVLIRGGGSKADLAAFDSRRVAEAVARSPLPVVTGLGHEIDQSIADQVAHTSTKTPTQAAEFLVQRVRSADQTLDVLGRRLQQAGSNLLAEARASLSGVEAGLRTAKFRLRAEELGLVRLTGLLGRAVQSRLEIERRSLTALRARLAASAPHIVDRSRLVLVSVGRRAATGSQSTLRRADTAIEALARLCSYLGPERTLARGFSITRDVRGRVVTAADQVQVGERVETETAGGRITSRVEERA